MIERDAMAAAAAMLATKRFDVTIVFILFLWRRCEKVSEIPVPPESS